MVPEPNTHSNFSTISILHFQRQFAFPHSYPQAFPQVY
ncbi:hypothetical protein URS_1440 [Acinetobacter ursingii]|nr:hypothetical protein URS_1440 [Acinetobacter ursingii]